MKNILVMLGIVLISLTTKSQFKIQKTNIDAAIKAKIKIADGQLDFSAKGSGLVFIFDKDSTDAEMDAFKKKFEVVINKKTPEIIIEKGRAENKRALFIDFEKNKLQSIPVGSSLILRTPDTEKFEIITILNKKGTSDNTGQPENPQTEIGKFWKYLDSVQIDLQKYAIPPDFCCDTCKTCEDYVFPFTNQITYDAVSGITYFLPYDFVKPMKAYSNKTKKDTKTKSPNANKINQAETTINLVGNDTCKKCPRLLKLCDTSCSAVLARGKFVVHNRHRIHLKTGDPIVYVVRNVNPYLYDVELIDTGFLVNNEATGLLENLLLVKHDKGISPQSAGGGVPATDVDMEHYLRIKAGLIHLNAEMGELLENYRVMSRFAHNCIEVRKQLALKAIDSTLTLLGKDPKQSFSSFVDINIDAGGTDSTLYKTLKALYGEFWRSKYVIAYRIPDVPEFDLMHFHLSIKRKKDAPYPDLLNTKYPTQIGYVRNFFKIDVSSGLYYGGIVDKEFSLRADSNLNIDPVLRGNRIVEEKVGKNEFGFVTFLHFYYKFGNFFNAGGLFGAGFNFSAEPKPRYFAGGSIMLGTNNRLCINGGIMWGNVKELSSQYPKEADGTYRWLPQSETTLATRNRLKSGYFISISYNLPFLKRNKGTAEVKPPEEKSKDESPTSDKKDADKGVGQSDKDNAGKKDDGDGKSTKTESASNLKLKKTVERYRKE